MAEYILELRDAGTGEVVLRGECVEDYMEVIQRVEVTKSDSPSREFVDGPRALVLSAHFNTPPSISKLTPRVVVER